MGNDSSTIDANQFDQLLEKLKSNIETTINESYRYSHFTNIEEIFEWKNKIIKLINKEIDKYKYNNLNNKNSQNTLSKNIERPTSNSRIQGRVDSQNKISNGYSNSRIQGRVRAPNKIPNGFTNAFSGFQGKTNAQNINPKESTTKFQGKNNIKNNYQKTENTNIQGENLKQKSILDNSKIQENNLNQRENKNVKLDFFTAKDIQEENKEITRIFQKESLNHIDDDEEVENKTIGYFLKEVALISRMAYNTSDELFKKMFNEFLKYKNKTKNILDLKLDEQLKKEFSSWVKEYEKDSKGKQAYSNYFNSFTGKGIYDNNKYPNNLLPQLIKLYFHCELSFPNVEVDFNLNSGIIFNHEKMIDFINKGNNRKVDFVILPSLFSNGNYLENGKFWVFTYKKDTFKFDQLKFERIVNKQEKYNATYSKKELSNSQTNNMSTKPKEIAKNSYSNPRDNEKKNYQHRKITNKNEQIYKKK